MKIWNGITLRITLLGWVVTLCTLALFIIVIVPEQKREFELGLESKGHGVAVSVQSVAAGAAVLEDYSAVVDQAMQVLAGDPQIEYVVMTKNDGFSIVIDRSTWKIAQLESGWRPTVRAGRSSIGVSPLVGHPVFQYALPFDYNGIPWGWIHIGLSLDNYNASVVRIYKTTAILTFLCGALSLLISLAYAAHLVQPIQALRSAVKKVARGDLSARAKVHSRDEIESLAKAFNEMTETILARNRMVESVSFAAQKFLSVVETDAVLRVLERIGQATGVHRAYILRIDTTEGELRAATEEEWTSKHSGAKGEQWDHFPWPNEAGGSSIQLLEQGQIVTAKPAEMAPSMRDSMDSRIRSIIHAPIVVMGSWWGVIGLEDFVKDRDWGEAERDSLRAIAEMLGASIIRKRVQEAMLAAKEAAEEANRAKSAFLANMSHELRTPLNAIIGYSEMLQEDAQEAGQAQTIADLGKIIFSGKHLLSLINDVLDLSKIEAGKTELRMEPFMAGAILNEVIDTAEALARTNHNKLVGRCEFSKVTMMTDRVKFRQVLLNLLSNACKFTENGTITVDVTLSELEGELWIHWQVRDTGIGISQSQRNKLFLPFSQVDQSTTREYGGSGLGLAISQRLCQMMGGYIDVESEPGNGSTFTIHLPVQPRQGVAEKSLLALAGSVGCRDESSEVEKQTVLVIDDDAMARELLQRLLSREGYVVLLAADGETGFSIASAEHPTAIVLDILMPGSSGWSVLSRLKATPELRRIPVIVHSISDDRALGRELGAAVFLQKPSESGELVAALRKLIGSGMAEAQREKDLL
jgi:signal transduction histidine kinase/CheY-like chemotaxis protein